MALIATMYRPFVFLVLTMPILASAAEHEIGVAQYSVLPDPRDCFGLPECGGYFLNEVNGAIPTNSEDFCSADLQVAVYVVRLMCRVGDGSLHEIYPSCSKPIFGDIEADPDYENYDMLVSPSCEQ